MKMRRNTTIIFLLVTLALSLLFGLADAIAAITKAKVIVWDHKGYDGWWKEVTSSVANITTEWGSSYNDDIGSVQVFGGAKVTLWKHSNYTGSSSTFTANDNKIRDAIRNEISSIEFFGPDAFVDTTSLSFGNLYLAGRESPEDYNDGVTKTVTLRNDGVSGTTLWWDLESVPTYATITSSSGSLSGSLGSGEEVTLTIWINPTSTGSLSDSFQIITSERESGDGDKTISLSADVYDTPAVSLVAPDLGTNSKVDVPVGEDVTFEVGSQPLSHTSISKYQWQSQVSGTDPLDDDWEDAPTSGEEAYSFDSAGSYTVYVRMVDSNNVKSDYLAISVQAWNRPTIEDDPPGTAIPTDDDNDGVFSDSELSGKASWLSDKYVGVVGKEVRLQADGQTNNPSDTSENIYMYVWDLGSDGEKQQLGITDYDGDDSVVIKDYKGVTGSDPRTVAAWIQTSTPNKAIVSWGRDANGKKWAFRLGSGGELRIGVADGSKSGVTNVANGYLHHVALTFDGSNVRDCKLYVDGLLEGLGEQEGEAVNTSSSNDVQIGTDFQNRFFNGEISEVAIWSRALSQTELEQHMNNGITGLESGLEKHLQGLVEFTPSTSNLNGTITVKAVTNYGIESEDKSFSLKIYDTVDANAGGAYDGVPSKDVELQGSIDNLSDYGGSATTAYQWRVSTEAGLQFDGVDDYVSIPNHADLNTGGPYTDRTIGLWFKTSDVSQQERILYQEGGVTNGFSLYVDDDKIYVGAWSIGSGWNGNWLSTDISAEADKWHHVALVLRGATDVEQADKLELWWDGALTTPTGNGASVDTHTGAIAIGAVMGGTRTDSGALSGDEINHFAGWVDDVAIFNRALDSDEMAELAGTVLGGAEDSLVGYWTFDEGDGTSTEDLSPNDNHGTLVYSPTWPSRDTDVSTDSDGGAIYQWTTTRDAIYVVEFEATVTTTEGLEIVGTDLTTVAVTAGSPVATPGVAYQGGIEGGDYSPIQFEGNVPDSVELDTADTEVTIAEWQWVFDKTVTYNQGVELDGNDSVELGDLAIDTENGLTLSAWIGPDSGDSTIISTANISTANHVFALGVDATGQPYFRTTTDDTVAHTVTSSFSIVNDGYWHYVVGIYDGDEMHLYLNGFLQESLAVDGTIQTDAGDVSIGEGFSGSIDDISIWERAVTERERSALQNGSLRNEFMLVGYWPFNEGSGTTVGNLKSDGNDGTISGDPLWVDSTLVEEDIWNPTQIYEKAGEYSATLRVKADTGRWSTVKETQITVTDGSIAGTVRAADLRTPVGDVRLTLTSSHVLGGDLSDLVLPGTNLQPNNLGGAYTTTDVDGYYSFGSLPLGNYRIVATKVEDDGTIHEFETAVQLPTLTLSVSDQEAIDFVDLSVFPVGGRVRSLPYDLDPTNPEVPDDNLLVSDVVVEAKPIGISISVESDPSKTTPDATGRNYSLPLFGGKYQFFARLDGRDISLDPDVPGSELLYDDDGTQESSAVRITTITGATGQVHFVDYTKRTLTVTVEDSGGFPIQVLPDLDANDPLYNQPIEANATLSGLGKTATNAVVETVDEDGETITTITYELPPGEYTLAVASDFEGQDIVFRDSDNPNELKTQLDVDLTTGDDEVTMVVPVQIQLEIGPSPNLMVDTFDTNSDGVLDAEDDFYEFLTNDPADDPPGLGLTDAQINGLEGYMFYYSPEPRTHTYAIQATANDHPVEDYTLAVTDQISQLTDDLASEQTDTIAVLFDTILSDHESELNSGTITAGLKSLFTDEGISLSDNATVQTIEFSGDDPNNPDKWMITDSTATYFLQADGDQLHVDEGTYAVTGGLPSIDTSDTPNVTAKQISFQAKKDGYKASETQDDFVTVLGDRLKGTAAKIVSVPNINYTVLHDPPGDNSYSFVDDSLIIKGIISNMTIRAKKTGQEIPVYPAPWSVERKIDGVDFDKLDDASDFGNKGLLDRHKGADDAEERFRLAAVAEMATGTALVVTGPLGFVQQLGRTFAAPTYLGPGGADGIVEYAIRANRHLETPSGDSIPDLLGPGRGDIYFGEGWTLGFQGRWRLGIVFDAGSGQWSPETQDVTTYDILDRTNQYVYTTRDIENIIENLDASIVEVSGDEALDLTSAQNTWIDLLEKNMAYQWSEFYVENADKLAELEAGEELSTLENWQLGHLQTAETNIANANGDAFEAFREAMDLPEDSSEASSDQKVETLIFSGGPAFEYSREIGESQLTTFTREISVSSDFATDFGIEFETGWDKSDPVTGYGVKLALEFKVGSTATSGIGTTYEAGAQAGFETEQTVGFLLQDDEVGDNYSTRVYEDPVWGTPLFIHDLGSVSSDPWEPGTNKAVDIRLERIPTQLSFLFGVAFSDSDIDDLDGNIIPVDLALAFTDNGITLDANPSVEIDTAGGRWEIKDSNGVFPVRLETQSDDTEILNVYQETTSEGPFDYHDGAHYRIKLVYAGERDLESDFSTINFLVYAPETDNKDNVTVRFNGQPDLYLVGLTKEGPTGNLVVSVYPPEVDQDNSYEKEYSVLIFVQEEADSQINASLTLTPRFADLQPPTAEIVAPYDGERISPAMFGDDVDNSTPETDDDPFTIQVISEDTDVTNIRIESRSKRQDGFGASGRCWEG